MVRPTKDIHRVHQPLSCYEVDLKIFKENKGKLTLSAFFIEAGYAYMKNNETRQRDEKRIIEIQELKKIISELQDKLNFEKLKNKKQLPEIKINETMAREFYTKKEINIKMSGKIPIVWETMFDRNMSELLRIGFNSTKSFENWCLNEYKKNGAKA